MDKPPTPPTNDPEDRARPFAIVHGLRAPLDAVAGYAYLLLDRVEGDQKTRTSLRSIISCAERMIGILQAPWRSGEAGQQGEDGGVSGWSAEHRRVWDELTETISAIARELLEIPDFAESQTARRSIEQILAAAEQSAGAIGAPDADEGYLPAPREEVVAAVSGVLQTREPGRRAPAASSGAGTVLVVDDDPNVREILSEYLKTKNIRVVTTANGRDALSAAKALAFDAVLLDIVMPEFDGFQTLRALKTSPKLRGVPVLMVSGFDPREALKRSLALGADDYIAKPFDPAFLFARLSSAIEKKRLHDREKDSHEKLRQAQRRSHELLLNILPASAAKQLEYGQKMIAHQFDNVTVLFCDLVSFTQYSSSITAPELVRRLNRVFQAFDALVVKYGVEKIKTVGDAYVAVGGLPEVRTDHAHRTARLALAMMSVMRDLKERKEMPLQVRIGMHSGPLTAGVIGKLKFAYDIWGDTVNVASRMESTGLPDEIQVSETTYELLRDSFDFEPRDPVSVKGKGMMRTYLLKGTFKKGTSTSDDKVVDISTQKRSRKQARR